MASVGDAEQGKDNTTAQRQSVVVSLQSAVSDTPSSAPTLTLPSMSGLTVRAMVAEAIVAQHQQSFSVLAPSASAPSILNGSANLLTGGTPLQFFITNNPSVSTASSVTTSASRELILPTKVEPNANPSFAYKIAALTQSGLPFLVTNAASGDSKPISVTAQAAASGEGGVGQPITVWPVPAGSGDAQTISVKMEGDVGRHSTTSHTTLQPVEVQIPMDHMQDSMDRSSDSDSSLHYVQTPSDLTDVTEVTVCAGSPIPSEYSDPRSPGGGKAPRQHRGGKVMPSAQCKEDKICRVCGDKALGCNFDAISCESCKAFFRRNALKDKQPKCLFEGGCKVDLNTRRFCPFCRLQKCLQVGMKKDLILGDNERKKRNEKVKQNRVKRQTKRPEPSEFSSPPLSNQPLSPPSSPLPGAMGYSTAESTNLLLMSKQMRCNEEPPVTSLFEMPASHVSTAASLLSLAVSAPPPPVELYTHQMRKLTSDENIMLQDLLQVYDLSFTVDLEPLIHVKHLDPSLNQLVNQSSITVLRLIKFAKRLDEFVRLPQESQIGILKGTWIHILLLRSVSVYDSERDVWVTPRGDIPTEILKNATGFVKLHDDHVQYCKSIKAIIRDDLSIVVMLLVIVLFSPEGPHVINRELVSNIQDKYLVLLKHYLESKYNFVRASEMFPQLMSKLRELKELAEVHGKYLLDINPNEIEPIMLEILDLK